MKRITKLLSLLTLPALLVGFVACGDGYKDVAERPEIETPAPAKTVVYPEKPAKKPDAPAVGAVPVITDYVSSETEKSYTVNKTETGVEISYRDISDWSYVYVPVADYTPEYGNAKITLENGDPAADRIAVQAVYYEAYDLGYAPVTVYRNDLSEGEQYVIFSLGEHMITDERYEPVKDNSVRDKTLLGFVIFIDSLPSYAPKDKEGSLKITNFEMLTDNDPKLLDRYVKPVIDFAGAEADGVTLQKTETSLGVSGTGTAFIPVSKYTSDYARFSLTLNGEAGGTAEVGVRYTFDGETKLLSAPETVSLTGDDREVTYNYLKMFAESADPDIFTQYVKDGTVCDIYVKLTGGSVTVDVKSATFVRTATGGAYVSDAWSSCSNVEVVRAKNGGNARIDYKYHSDWDSSISVPVRRGADIKKIEFKIYAPEGISHLGVGVSSTSLLNTNNQGPGRYILRPSRNMFEFTESGSGLQSVIVKYEEEPNINGLEERLAYDKATGVYTFTYDFTNMRDEAGKSLSDYMITSIILYLNCPCSGNDQKAHEFEGKRSLYLLSVELYTE